MGSDKHDMVGKRFGSLVVVRRVNGDVNRYIRWVCQCDCGKQITVISKDLRSGRVTSCDNCSYHMTDRKMIRSISLLKGAIGRYIDPYESLANAIVLTAVEDYRSALREHNEGLEASLIHFFRSTWYATLTTVDPNFLIDQLRREYIKSV